MYSLALGSSKPMPQSSSSTPSSLDDDMQKMKRCKYCQKGGHTIDKCKKLTKWNEKKK